MAFTTSRKCRYCRASLVRLETNGIGRVVEVETPCRCLRMLRAGLCCDCGAPVAGTKGKARRCAEHKKAALRAATRAHYRRRKLETGSSYLSTTKNLHRSAAYKARARAKARERVRARTPEQRERYRQSRRKYSKYGAAEREAKLAYMREYNKRPEVIARRAEYDRLRRQRRAEEVA